MRLQLTSCQNDSRAYKSPRNKISAAAPADPAKRFPRIRKARGRSLLTATGLCLSDTAFNGYRSTPCDALNQLYHRPNGSEKPPPSPVPPSLLPLPLP